MALSEAQRSMLEYLKRKPIISNCVPGGTTGMLRRLQAIGLTEFRDNRPVEWHITPAGRAALLDRPLPLSKEEQ